jgi:heme/copper-type cytochrome/quinol oxidase subunit 3
MSTAIESLDDSMIRGRAGSPALTGAITAYAGVAMFMTALCGTYLSVRNSSGDGFLDKAVFNNYVAFMVTVTFALASVASGWAVASMRIGHRRWSSSGFGLAAFLNLAAANLIWFIVKDLKFVSIGSPGYGVIVYGLFIGAAVTTAIGFFASVSGLLRALGGQATAAQPHYGVLAMWGQHLAGAAWIAVYGCVYLLK